MKTSEGLIGDVKGGEEKKMNYEVINSIFYIQIITAVEVCDGLVSQLRSV